MDPNEKIRDVLAETGQMERLLACIEFSKALVSVYDMESLLAIILARINGLIPAANWSLLLLDPPTGELYFAVVVGVEPELVKGVRLKLGKASQGRRPRKANLYLSRMSNTIGASPAWWISSPALKPVPS